MTTSSLADEDLKHPRSVAAFRTMKALVACYAGLSVLTLIAIILLRNHPAIVNPAVWIRTTIVAATSLLMVSFATRASGGHGRSYLRLRLTSTVVVVAIVVIIALPGTFPVWLKIEQGVCGLLLLGVAAVVNGKHLRSLFAGK